MAIVLAAGMEHILSCCCASVSHAKGIVTSERRRLDADADGSENAARISVPAYSADPTGSGRLGPDVALGACARTARSSVRGGDVKCQIPTTKRTAKARTTSTEIFRVSREAARASVRTLGVSRQRL